MTDLWVHHNVAGKRYPDGLGLFGEFGCVEEVDATSESGQGSEGHGGILD